MKWEKDLLPRWGGAEPSHQYEVPKRLSLNEWACRVLGHREAGGAAEEANGKIVFRFMLEISIW